jgi:hypothetical protein
MSFFISHKFDEILFKQDSRIVFIKFDKSLLSNLMNRSQFDEMRLSESSHQKHVRRLTSRERAYVTR